MTKWKKINHWEYDLPYEGETFLVRYVTASPYTNEPKIPVFLVATSVLDDKGKIAYQVDWDESRLDPTRITHISKIEEPLP